MRERAELTTSRADSSPPLTSAATSLTGLSIRSVALISAGGSLRENEW
jgi:hypothetical protein